jgi:hypothetical protein
MLSRIFSVILIFRGVITAETYHYQLVEALVRISSRVATIRKTYGGK